MAKLNLNSIRPSITYPGHMTFEEQMEYDLKSPFPPSAESIASMRMMLDEEFMLAALEDSMAQIGKRAKRVRCGNFSIGNSFSVIDISHCPDHPWHNNVKIAFDYANKLRVRHGFPADPWPVVPTRPPYFYQPPTANRRLVWEPVIEEIKEAHRLFRRFSREKMIPFSVGSNGEPKRRIRSFNPHAGEILFQIQEVA